MTAPAACSCVVSSSSTGGYSLRSAATDSDTSGVRTLTICAPSSSLTTSVTMSSVRVGSAANCTSRGDTNTRYSWSSAPPSSVAMRYRSVAHQRRRFPSDVSSTIASTERSSGSANDINANASRHSSIGMSTTNSITHPPFRSRGRDEVATSTVIALTRSLSPPAT